MLDEKGRASECWVFHDWGKWETFEQGKVLRNDKTAQILGHEPVIIGAYEYQRRICKLCGKSQLREAGA